MAGFQEREQASPEERAVHFFFQHLNMLFSYRGLRAYKAKFATCVGAAIRRVPQRAGPAAAGAGAR